MDIEEVYEALKAVGVLCEESNMVLGVYILGDGPLAGAHVTYTDIETVGLPALCAATTEGN